MMLNYHTPFVTYDFEAIGSITAGPGQRGEAKRQIQLKGRKEGRKDDKKDPRDRKNERTNERKKKAHFDHWAEGIYLLK